MKVGRHHPSSFAGKRMHGSPVRLKASYIGRCHRTSPWCSHPSLEFHGSYLIEVGPSRPAHTAESSLKDAVIGFVASCLAPMRLAGCHRRSMNQLNAFSALVVSHHGSIDAHWKVEDEALAFEAYCVKQPLRVLSDHLIRSRMAAFLAKITPFLPAGRH